MSAWRIRTIATLLLALSALLAGCGGSGDGDGRGGAAGPSTTGTVGPTASTTSPASTVGESTTAAGPVVRLAGDGLGVAALGDALAPATAALTAALGPADYQGRWTDRYCDTGEGGGGQLFVWGELAVVFSDDKDAPTGIVPKGPRYLWGYTYGGVVYDPAASRDVPLKRALGLRTGEGIGLGSKARDVEAAYGGRAVYEDGEPGEFPPPAYEVDRASGRELFLRLDKRPPDGAVQMVLAGRNCGE